MSAIVQSRAVFSGGANTSGFGVVLASTPTPGNILIACVTAFQGFASVGASWVDSGITVTDGNSGVNKILYRYVQASDPTTFSFGTPNNATFWSASVVEVDGVTGVFLNDVAVSVTGTALQTTNPFTTSALASARINPLALAFVETPQGSTPSGVFDGAWTHVASNSGGGYGFGVASQQFTGPAGTNVQTTITWTRAFSSAYVVLTIEPNPDPVQSRITQSKLILGVKGTPQSRITQSKLILGLRLQKPPCAVREADLWRIERTDGTIYRFTSHNRNMTFRGELYKACGSLTSSALQLSADLGQTDNVDLSGVIYEGGITELDLWSGRFAGAEVQIWRVSWDGTTPPVLVTSGAVGNTKFEDQPFTFEIITAGERLTQRALLQPVMPTCRFKTYDTRCSLDPADFVVTGSVTATAGNNLFTGNARRAFFDSSRTEADAYFTRGKITWTSGDNIGQTADVKQYLQANGAFILETRLQYGISLGDAYSLLPGDDHTFSTCRDKFNNAINFGGFHKVKGNDDLAEQGRGE